MSTPASQPILNALTPDRQKLEVLRQHFPQAIEMGVDGHIRINASYADIPVKERWKIDSAKQFFKALQDLPALKDGGVHIKYQTKINGESLSQLISYMT